MPSEFLIDSGKGAEPTVAGAGGLRESAELAEIASGWNCRESSSTSNLRTWICVCCVDDLNGEVS